MPDDGEELRTRFTELSRARENVYAFLGSAFLSPPTERSLGALAGEDFLAGAAELFDIPTLASLKRYAKAAEQTAELQRQAHHEFMNLFKVPGGQYIMPYESVFRDARDVGGRQVKGLLMGRSAIDVQKWYRLAAVEISDDYKDLPDHIGLELNFLAYLCAKEQGFARNGDQARLTRAWEIERDFLAAHVVPWTPQLCAKLRDKSQHAYFRTVADLLVEFSRRDLATLEALLGPSTEAPIPGYEPIE